MRVFFPEDELSFGDVSAGETTEYQDVLNGVYGYAAYRFEIDGQGVLQPVEDWTGESPLNGTSFTYVIDFGSKRPQGGRLKFIEILIDN